MSTALATLTSKLAARLDMGDGTDLMETLKATAFRSTADKPVTDAQLTALLVVANQYGLNPWTKEIYAFPDKNNGIVPVVGVDGWSRIINEHAQFDGLEFEQNDDCCTCVIYRKDRSHATRVTEYMVECKRNTPPWQSHPYRMLRHKALIQCARLAFGFVGIFDVDEAERIVENVGVTKTIDPATGEIKPASKVATLPPYPAEKFAHNLPKWREHIASGSKQANEIIAWLETKNSLTEDQKSQIQAPIQNSETVLEAA